MLKTARYRIGVVGLGTHGMEAVLPGIENSRHWEVVAVADINSDQLHGIPHLPGYSTVDAMLQKEKMDALYIATLPDTHAPIAITSLEHGVHVICEKPMAADTEACRRILEVSQRVGREVLVMFENRFQTYNQKVRRWICEGVLGRVEAIHFQSFGKHPTLQPRRTRLLNAAGCLDCGIHNLDLARYWNNGACWDIIHALGTWFDEVVNMPPHVGILARLDNGVMVTFEDSFSYGYGVESAPYDFGKCSLAIVGTHGVISDGIEEGGQRVFRLITDRRCESVPINATHHRDEIPKVIDAFANRLWGEIDEETRASLAGGEDGYEAQRIVDEVCRQAVVMKPIFKNS